MSNDDRVHHCQKCKEMKTVIFLFPYIPTSYKLITLSENNTNSLQKYCNKVKYKYCYVHQFKYCIKELLT